MRLEKLTWLRLNLLKKEFKGLLWLVDDQLLEEVLKHLVDLVLFEVLLDRLHVVKFLEFVHFVTI